MNHNPRKNRAVCVFAKGSVWCLRGLCVLTVVTIVGAAGLLLVLKIRADWNWAEAMKSLLLFLAVFALIGLWLSLTHLLKKWYEWAKSYAKNC
jgi:hypothetical protein